LNLCLSTCTCKSNKLVYLFIHSLLFHRVTLPSFLPTFLPSFLPSIIYSFLPSFLPSSIPSFLHSSIPSFLHSSIPSFLPSFHHLFLPSFIHSFLHSIMHSATHSFPHFFSSGLHMLTPVPRCRCAGECSCCGCCGCSIQRHGSRRRGIPSSGGPRTTYRIRPAEKEKVRDISALFVLGAFFNSTFHTISGNISYHFRRHVTSYLVKQDPSI
jgi:hypothetical protein